LPSTWWTRSALKDSMALPLLGGSGWPAGYFALAVLGAAIA
jgi:hypothetical protein